METDYDPQIDKGELEGEKLIDIYADLGLFLRYDKQPQDSIVELEDTNEDITNELVYLMGQKAVNVEEGLVSLRSSERETAEKIAKEVYENRMIASDIIEETWVPDYLSHPEIDEERSAPLENVLEQKPDEEIPGRIFEILSESQPLKPKEVENKLAVEINFNIEPWLKYLETQDILKRYEENQYGLAKEEILDNFEETFNAKGRIKEHHRYRNDPWKL